MKWCLSAATKPWYQIIMIGYSNPILSRVGDTKCMYIVVKKKKKKETTSLTAWSTSSIRRGLAPQRSRICLNEIHLRLAIIISNDLAAILTELELLGVLRVVLRPMRQIKSLGVWIQCVGELNETAHDVEGIFTQRRWNRAECIEDDVGNMEGPKDRNIVELGGIQKLQLTQ